MAEYDKLLSEKTKIVTSNHISNALGTINPIKYNFIFALLFELMVQAVHLKPDVQELDCDFYVFSDIKYDPYRNWNFIRKRSVEQTSSLSRWWRNDQRGDSKTTYAELPIILAGSQTLLAESFCGYRLYE
jgi:hypothetical protein